MKRLLVDLARVPATIVWIFFVGSWIARLCGIPLRATFWAMDRQSYRLTRLQFVWAFGVLVIGLGMFIFGLDSDVVQRVLLEKRWSAKWGDLGFLLGLSVFMGVVIGYWCAPTQNDESPVTDLDLSRRQ